MIQSTACFICCFIFIGGNVIGALQAEGVGHDLNLGPEQPDLKQPRLDKKEDASLNRLPGVHVDLSADPGAVELEYVAVPARPGDATGGWSIVVPSALVTQVEGSDGDGGRTLSPQDENGKKVDPTVGINSIATINNVIDIADKASAVQEVKRKDVAGAKAQLTAAEADKDAGGGMTDREQEEEDSDDEKRDSKLLFDVVSSMKDWTNRHEEKLVFGMFNRAKRDEEVVCYGDLGCFRDEGPFNYLDMLPSPPEEIGTVFYLFTRSNKEIPQILEYNNISTVVDSNYDSTIPTKFIIHGFGSSCSKVWPREMRLSFLAVEVCNVICVDWAAGAVDPNYVRAAVNTRLVGKQVALLIQSINENLGSINNRTHLIGFSLGAHVSGFVGKELRNLSRITGLDPAGPLFEGYSSKVRLDKTDANYVDVIHSNGDSLIIGGLGAWEPIGDVDFYPNGGRAQRGCQNLLIGGLYDFIYSYSSKNESYRYLCNHRRAYKLFTDSISPKCRFTAFPCDSYEKFETGQCFQCNSEVGECGQLGYYSDQSPGRGSLYLLTRDEEPFCANQFKIVLEFTGSRLPVYTYGEIQAKIVTVEGINETFSLTNSPDQLLTSGGRIEKLIVAHPALVNLAEIHLLYISYAGWIYTGRPGWSLDSVTVSDGLGLVMSYCKESGEILPSGLPVARKLHKGDCHPIMKQKSESIVDKYRKPGIPNTISSYLQPPHTTTSPPTGSPPFRATASQQPDLVVPYQAANTYVVPETSSGRVPGATKNGDHDMSGSRPMVMPAKGDAASTAPNSPAVSSTYNLNSSIQKIQSWKSKVGGGQVRPTTVAHPPPPPLIGLPPGTWNVVTAHQGGLPPPLHIYTPHVSIPKDKTPGHSTVSSMASTYPTSSLVPFPARRRPSSDNNSMRPPPGTYVMPPRSQTVDMMFAETTASVNFPSNKGSGFSDQATTRIDLVDESDVILVGQDSVELSANAVLDEKGEENSTVKTDILSDTQLTIFKVGPDNNVERVENISTIDNNTSDNAKYKYVILHKLPNGEAVNLENLKTYSLADIENSDKDMFSFDEEGYENGSQEGEIFFDVPRRQSDYEFSHGLDEFIIYHRDDLDLNTSFLDNLHQQYYYYQRPDGVYPMYSSGSVHHRTQPVNSLSGGGVTKYTSDPLYNMNPEDKAKLEDKVEKVLSGAFQEQGNQSTQYVVRDIPPIDRSDVLWNKTYEEPRSSERGREVDDVGLSLIEASTGLTKEKIIQLSRLGHITTGDDKIAGVLISDDQADLQLLPPRLSALLSKNRQPKYHGHRQNKIAPVFKGDHRSASPRQQHGRRLGGHRGHPPHTQLIPREDQSRYIPLRVSNKAILNRPVPQTLSNLAEHKGITSFSSHHELPQQPVAYNLGSLSKQADHSQPSVAHSSTAAPEQKELPPQPVGSLTEQRESQPPQAAIPPLSISMEDKQLPSVATTHHDGGISLGVEETPVQASLHVARSKGAQGPYVQEGPHALHSFPDQQELPSQQVTFVTSSFPEHQQLPQLLHETPSGWNDKEEMVDQLFFPYTTTEYTTGLTDDLALTGSQLDPELLASTGGQFVSELLPLSSLPPPGRQLGPEPLPLTLSAASSRPFKQAGHQPASQSHPQPEADGHVLHQTNQDSIPSSSRLRRPVYNQDPTRVNEPAISSHFENFDKTSGDAETPSANADSGEHKPLTGSSPHALAARTDQIEPETLLSLRQKDHGIAGRRRFLVTSGESMERRNRPPTRGDAVLLSNAAPRPGPSQDARTYRTKSATQQSDHIGGSGQHSDVYNTDISQSGSRRPEKAFRDQTYLERAALPIVGHQRSYHADKASGTAASHPIDVTHESLPVVGGG